MVAHSRGTVRWRQGDDVRQALDHVRRQVNGRDEGESVLEQGVPWRPSNWERPGLRVLQSEILAARDISEDRGDGWVLIRRLHVLELAKRGTDPLACFLASMVWGFGDRGYGAARTERVVDPYSRDHLRVRFHEFAEAALAGPATSWDAITSSHKVKHLGPAFGTKVTYFFAAAAHDPPSPLPLIADANTSLAMWKLCGLSRSSWRRSAYLEYVDQAHMWAADLGCRVDEIERALFDIGRSMSKGS